MGLHHPFLTRYSVCVCVFDMVRTSSLNADGDERKSCRNYIRFWLSSLRMHADGAPVILVGTRKDSVSLNQNRRNHS